MEREDANQLLVAHEISLAFTLTFLEAQKEASCSLVQDITILDGKYHKSFWLLMMKRFFLHIKLEIKNTGVREELRKIVPQNQNYIYIDELVLLRVAIIHHDKKKAGCRDT